MALLSTFQMFPHPLESHGKHPVACYRNRLDPKKGILTSRVSIRLGVNSTPLYDQGVKNGNPRGRESRKSLEGRSQNYYSLTQSTYVHLVHAAYCVYMKGVIF